MKNRVRLVLALVLFLTGGLALAGAQPVSLTILHTNDTHGHLQPFSYPDSSVGTRDLQGLRTYKDIGGIARRATLVKQIRDEVKAKGGTSWLVDVGDYSDGTPFSIEYHGEADVAAMNAVGYDFGTLGNHEFNNPAAQVRKLVAASKYSLLAANITDSATGQPLVPPTAVRTIGSLRVGLFGLITHEAATYPAGKDGLKVTDEIEAAKAAVAALNGKCDVIVVLSHAGEDWDEKIAAAVPEIDVIVGGHSHSRLPSGEFIWHSEDLRSSEVNGTVIVQAHQWGGELGRLDLLFAKDAKGQWRLDRYRARLIPVTGALADDPSVAAVVSKYWDPIAPRYAEVVGQAVGEFSTRGDDQAEYNLMDDALRETFHTDFAVENMGGIRAPLLRGPITRGDLVMLDPFANTVVTFKAKGRELKAMLARYAPSVSGIKYRIQGKELVEASIGGQSIDDDKVYTGVTNSYFAGYALKGLAQEDTGKPRLDTLVSYIKEKGSVRPAYDGRRIVIRD